MKTLKYTTALLVLLIAATSTFQGQSRRSPQERKEKERTANQQVRRSSPQRTREIRTDRRSTQPARQVERRDVRTPRNARPEKRDVRVQRNARPERRDVRTPGNARPEKRNVRVQRPSKPESRAGNRNVQRQRPSRKDSPTAGSNARRQSIERRTPVQPERRAERHRERRPVSISTRNNPRSDYRSAGSRVYVEPNRQRAMKANKYSKKRYYGGNYYHYVYPTKRVKIHYHYDTYVHDYHVLYFPVYRNIYWTRAMYRDYRRWYPDYRWRYKFGYRIQTIPVFDAKYNLGEVAMVYGRVYATWHNRETDDYLLFFGGDYPYQEFTVVLPGRVARRFSWRPERYFLGEHITVTGLITTFEGIPEIIVKHKRQIGLY